LDWLASAASVSTKTNLIGSMKMGKQKGRIRLFQTIEKLESRKLLAVASVVENGLLKITGDSDGAVEIIAKSSSQIEISDNGVSIGTFDGVKAININIDASGIANNVVTLKLDGASVDRVIANLGGGDNSMVLATGSIKGSLSYKGGSCVDNLELAAGSTVGRNVYAVLGDGSNAVKAGAAITGSLLVSGGVDDDTVSILAEAAIGKSVGLSLGSGDNTVNVAGTMEQSLMLKTGSGNDTVAVESTAYVGGSVLASLGSGDNTLTHNGEIAKNLRVTSKTSTDQVTVGSEAIVGGNTIERLGVGIRGHHGEGREHSTPKTNLRSTIRGRR
jgi:hypothetical protein